MIADRDAFVRPPRRPLTGGVALAVLTVGVLASLLAVQPIDPATADAPATEFSAARAYRHVERIAARPHPVGSTANHRVRDYLVRQLERLGLDPELQRAVGMDPSPRRPPTLATVENVVATLPGRASTGRVFLVAHYDSVDAGPGASDDGAGVAAMLEIARALTAGDRPRNDVVFVFTDGEESGLCGAEAFVREHPLARDGGVVVNLEARGSRGSVVMFETSPGNAGVVSGFARYAARPVGTSVAVEVYRRLPNDTDFTAFLDAPRAEFAGVNSAYLDGSVAYHTPLDTPGAMDRASLQHHGGNALGLVRGFGADDLRHLDTGGDASYFPVWGMLVRYPGGLTWPLAGLAVAAVLALGWLARRRGLASAPRMAAGAGLSLLGLILPAVAATGLWVAAVAVWPDLGSYPVGEPHHPGLLRLAVLAAAAVAFLGWYVLARRIGGVAVAVGALGWPALLGVATAAVAPGASYLGAIPALAGGLAGIGALLLARRPYPAVAVLSLGALVGALVYAPTVALLFPALGLKTAAAPALLAALAGFGFLPLLELVLPAGSRGARRWRGPGIASAVAAVMAFALALGGVAVNRPGPEQPQPTHLVYALDADDGEAVWLSADRQPPDWTSGYVTRPPRPRRDLPTLHGDPLRSGAAKPATLAEPEVKLLSDRRESGNRVVRLRLRSPRGAPIVALHLDRGIEVAHAVVAGRRVPTGRVERVGRWGFGFTYVTMPADGIEVTLTVRGDRRLRMRVTDQSQGLEGLPGYTRRPGSLTVAGGHVTDAVLVARTVTL